MAILVTGGAGYIGSHVCVELLQRGFEIIVIDNFINSKPESLKRVAEIAGKDFRVYATDLLHKDKLNNIFIDNQVEAVVHLAGRKAVDESMDFPLLYYQNNIVGTIHLCEVMKEHDVKKIVFSSSATVYGHTDQVPITEEAKLDAVNPYGRTKQMIEAIFKDLYVADETWSIALLRYFNPIGAHKSGLIGEDPNGIPNNLLPCISQVAVGKMDKLTIYGNGYQTRDGTGVRDYIHVVDLAIGHIKALKKIQLTTGVDAYNLGTGIGYSVMDIVKAFEKASSKSIPYTIMAKRPGDIGICYANPSKAEKELGFQAIRGIETMCEDAWRWQLNNPNGYDE